MIVIWKYKNIQKNVPINIVKLISNIFLAVETVLSLLSQGLKVLKSIQFDFRKCAATLHMPNSADTFHTYKEKHQQMHVEQN